MLVCSHIPVHPKSEKFDCPHSLTRCVLVVSANLTLSTLSRAITAVDPTVSYAFTNIDPTDDTNGGQPGGNIRTAYLYNPQVLRLRSSNPGTATSATEVLPDLSLTFNPGLIDPQNPAWVDSRKPLVAQWETLDGTASFFTVNVHFTSKGGSSSIHGDARPPVNGGVAVRSAQANITAVSSTLLSFIPLSPVFVSQLLVLTHAPGPRCRLQNFIASILGLDRSAAVIAAGDFNEFAFVAPLEAFEEISDLRDADAVAGLKPEERYTYLFDMNSQQLDHAYVSSGISAVDIDHVHINTWAVGASDHDPTVLKVGVCAR